MMLGDKLPRFRADLKVAPTPDRKGLFEVTDPVAQKHFTLYDFELSMARMMDGKRTAQAVIESSTKLAIPVTLESLEKFVRQLRAYGFVEDGVPAAGGAAEKTWEPRTEWSPEVREMFRTALVKFRQNRFDEAREYLGAILAVDKTIPEAQEVLDAITEREKHPPPAQPGERVAARVAQVKGLPKWTFAAAGGVVLLAVLLVPFPRTLNATVSLQGAAGVAVAAPRELVVKEAVAADGAWVETGAPLLKLDSSEREAALKKLDDEIAELEKKVVIATKLSKKKGAKPTVAARAKELQGMVDAAKAEREKAKAAPVDDVFASPATGVVSELVAKGGTKIAAGGNVARIVDPRILRMVATVDGRAASALEKGQKLTANLKGQTLDLTVEEVDGERASCALANGNREFAAGDSGTATIKVANKSLVGRLLR